MKSVFRSKQTPPETPEDRTLAKRFEQKVRLSLLALLFERIWEALLWPFFVVATFLVVTLLDLWSITPPLAHRVLLGAFGLALAVSFLPLIRIALPTREEALRRLETQGQCQAPPRLFLRGSPRHHSRPRRRRCLWAAHRERLSRLIQTAEADLAGAPDRPQGPVCHPRASFSSALVAARVRRRPQGLGSAALRLLSGSEQRPVAAQARCLGDAAGLYRGRAHRACRRQRDGRRGLRDLPRAVVA